LPDSLDFILRLTFFYLTHSLFASQRFKRRIEISAGKRLPGYRLTYNVVSMLIFVWVMLAWQSTKVLFVAPGIWSLVMYGIQFIILWIGFICLRQTGLGSFIGISLDNPPKIITSGCYGIVRHPLYLLGILFLLLNPVITTRWIVLSLATIPYFIFGALIEEKRMIQILGENYRKYQNEVPFIIPCFKVKSSRSS